jgi:hypothetical protein
MDKENTKDKVIKSVHNKKVIYYHSSTEFGDGDVRSVYRQTWEIYGTDEAQHSRRYEK